MVDNCLKSLSADNKEGYEMKKRNKERHEKSKCEKSPSGKHRFKHGNCSGSWHHDDPGGPIFEHKSKKCIYCGFEICYGWDKAERISEGWY